jgi:hypothetical protein
MTEKEQKYDPITRAINDTYATDFFGNKRWPPERFINLCRMRGITGELWNHATLSPPLKLLVLETRDVEEAKLDALLHSFAETIKFDEAALRRHYFAVKFGLEDVFLVHVAERDKEHQKLTRLAEEAEETLPSEEPTESQKTIDEEESDED